MLLPVAATLVGILLAIGGAQEFYFLGIVNQETQPFFVGLLGLATGVLLVVAGVSLAFRWARSRFVVLSAASLNLVFLVYAAAPPHRNVGVLALVLGAGVSLALLYHARRDRGPRDVSMLPAR